MCIYVDKYAFVIHNMLMETKTVIHNTCVFTVICGKFLKTTVIKTYITNTKIVV